MLSAATHPLCSLFAGSQLNGQSDDTREKSSCQQVPENERVLAEVQKRSVRTCSASCVSGKKCGVHGLHQLCRLWGSQWTSDQRASLAASRRLAWASCLHPGEASSLHSPFSAQSCPAPNAVQLSHRHTSAKCPSEGCKLQICWLGGCGL